jgi:hypothetical protein
MSNESDTIAQIRQKLVTDTHKRDLVVVNGYLCIVKPFKTYYERGLSLGDCSVDGRPVASGECYLEIRDGTMKSIVMDVRISLLASKNEHKFIEILKISFDEKGLEAQEAVFTLETLVMHAIYILYGRTGTTRIVTSANFDYAGVVGIPAINYFIKRFDLVCDGSLQVAVIQAGQYDRRAQKQYKKYMKSLHIKNSN